MDRDGDGLMVMVMVVVMVMVLIVNGSAEQFLRTVQNGTAREPIENP